MPSYTCSTCGREFSRHASLRNHIKTHDNTDIDRILQEVSKEIVQAREQQREEELIYDEQLEEMIE